MGKIIDSGLKQFQSVFSKIQQALLQTTNLKV